MFFQLLYRLQWDRERALAEPQVVDFFTVGAQTLDFLVEIEISRAGSSSKIFFDPF